MKILVVEDDVQVARALRINLAARGYQVVIASDGTAGLTAASDGQPDLVLLDLGLPDIDGTEVISGLRGWSTVPIVVLSGRSDATSVVTALDLGADDYVTKPFGMAELLARLRAAMRRGHCAGPVADPPKIETGSFTIDLPNKKAWRQGEPVHLTRTEWAVLEVLVRNQGRLVTQKQLLDEVWGEEHRADVHYVRIYIGQLRQKLEPHPARPKYLITEQGMGYRLELTSAS